MKSCLASLKITPLLLFSARSVVVVDVVYAVDVVDVVDTLTRQFVFSVFPCAMV